MLLWSLNCNGGENFFSQPQGLLQCVLSPDNNTLAASHSNGDIYIVNTEGAHVKQLCNHKKPITALAWGHHGLASVSRNNELTIWNPFTEKVTIKNYPHALHALAWSPCGNYLAISLHDASICIEEINGTKKYLRGHDDIVHNALAWSPDGKYLVSAGADKNIILWDIHKGTNMKLAKDKQDITALTWSPDGKILAGSSFQDMWLFDIKNNIFLLMAHGSHGANALAWKQDGTSFFTGSNDHYIRHFLYGNPQPIATVKQHSEAVRGLAWSARRNILFSAGEDGLLCAWSF